MQKQTDITGRIPEIGDVIAFNPAQYKGLVHGTCIGFGKTGLPTVQLYERYGDGYYGQSVGPTLKDKHYRPKTGFIIVGNENLGLDEETGSVR